MPMIRTTHVRGNSRGFRGFRGGRGRGNFSPSTSRPVQPPTVISGYPSTAAPPIVTPSHHEYLRGSVYGQGYASGQPSYNAWQPRNPVASSSCQSPSLTYPSSSAGQPHPPSQSQAYNSSLSGQRAGSSNAATSDRNGALGTNDRLSDGPQPRHKPVRRGRRNNLKNEILFVDLPEACRKGAPRMKNNRAEWLQKQVSRIQAERDVRVTSHTYLEDRVQLACRPRDASEAPMDEGAEPNQEEDQAAGLALPLSLVSHSRPSESSSAAAPHAVHNTVSRGPFSTTIVTP